MRKSRKQEIIENVMNVFSQFNSIENAVEMRVLCCIARVSEAEAFRAISCLVNEGIKIRLTDGLPHKLYLEKNE